MSFQNKGSCQNSISCFRVLSLHRLQIDCNCDLYTGIQSQFASLSNSKSGVIQFRQRCNLLYTDCFHLVLVKYH
jgi:hypothetical protein